MPCISKVLKKGVSMRRDIGLYSKFANDWHPPLDWYIPGESLLEWVKTEAAGIAGKGVAPTKSGADAANAWDLTSYGEWVGAWQKLLNDATLKSKKLYFKAGNRTIVKSSTPNGDGFYVADDALAGTDSTEGQIWNRTAGASYREYGKFMEARYGAYNSGGGPLAQAAWSKEMAANLRKVLNGSVDYSTKGATDIEAALPSLACAMFLSEPARNKREFVVGLMMLDLIGDTYSASNPRKKYTLTKVFTHPDRLGSGVMAKTQSGPQEKRWKNTGSKSSPTWTAQPQTMGNLRKKDLHKVEGKYPASPSGSARTTDAIDVASDYIQQKEASVVCRWVAKLLQDANADDNIITVTALQVGGSVGKTKIVPSSLVTQVSPYASQKDLQEYADLHIKEIKGLIQKRAASFS